MKNKENNGNCLATYQRTGEKGLEQGETSAMVERSVMAGCLYPQERLCGASPPAAEKADLPLLRCKLKSVMEETDYSRSNQ